MSDFGAPTVVAARITVDPSGVTGGVATANNSFATLEKAVAQNWWGLKNLGLVFAALPSAVAVGAGAAIKAASGIQDAMVDVARTTDLTGPALDTLQAQLFEIGNTRATPTLEILGVAESAGALGIAQDDIVAFTQTVVDMASTTDVSSQNAATGLARLAGLTGTTAGGFDNLASSIFETGVSTAATETDILALSQRLAGIGAVVGLSANQIIGWSASILSAGVRTQEGATQFQKTLVDIQRAITQNGSDLEGWARIAGTSASAFADAFKSDPNAAILSVIQGLASMIQSGKDVTGALDAVGVKEQRQIKLLELLAQAQSQTANENLKASNILGIAAKGYQDTERFQSAVERRNKTFTASLQELQNTLTQTAAALGSSLLGPLTTLVNQVQILALGFGQIPGPVKAVAGVLLGLATIVSLFLAGLFLVGPRLIIAFDALQRVAGAAGGLIGPLAGVAAESQSAAGGQQNLANTATQAAVAISEEDAALLAMQVNLGIITQEEYAAATGQQQLNNAQVVGASTSQNLSIWMRRVGQAAILASAVMVGLTAYTYALGKAQQDAENAQKDAQKANEDLTASMRRTGSAVNDQTTAIIQQLPAYQQAASAARDLGVSEAQILAIIQGTAGAQQWQAFLDATAAKYGEGSDAANNLIRTVYNLRQVFKNSAGDAGVSVNALKDETATMGDLGDQTAETAAQLNEFRDKQIDIAQATMDFVDASLAAAVASLDLADSQDKLAAAQDKAAHAGEYEYQAVLKVREALLDHAKAAADVADAEAEVASAAQRSAAAVIDAENSLHDAWDARIEALDKVKEKEKELSDLQNNGAETQDKLRDATNKLNDARIRLGQATLNVRDLEENLAYLQQQGAGARDIEEAEQALAKAKQDVSNATDDQIDAQKELNDLTDPVKRAEALAKAERDLAAARRDAETSLANIIKAEQDLEQARRDQADNRLQIQAEQDLVQAQEAEVGAAIAAQEAQQELNAIRNGSIARDAQRAELEYEGQLVATAKANAEVVKQTALMNGETWDAGKAAHALADELGKLNVVTDEAAAKRENFLNVLKGAPNIPDKAKGGTGPSGDGGDGASGLGGGGDGIGLPPDALPKAKATFQDFLMGILSGGGAFIVATLGAQLAKIGFGKIFPPSAGAELTAGLETAGVEGGTGLAGGIASGAEAELAAGGAATAIEGGAVAAGTSALAIAGAVIAAVLVVAIVGFLTVHFWPEISGFFADVGEKIGGKAEEWFGSFLDFFEKLPGWIGEQFQKLPGILAQVFLGIITGGASFVFQFREQIVGMFSQLSEDAAYWGAYILGTIINWMFVKPVEAAIYFGTVFVPTVIGIFLDLLGKLPGVLVKIKDAVVFGFFAVQEAGADAIRFMYYKILDFFEALPEAAGALIRGFRDNAGTWFSDAGNTIKDKFLEGAEKVADWFIKLPGRAQDIVTNLIKSVGSWFSDIGHAIWDGFHDALFGSPKTKIEYTLEDINAAMITTVANMKTNVRQLNGLNVDPFASAADSIVAGSKMVKQELSDFGVNAGFDPFAGGIAMQPGVVRAGNTINNTYNDHLQVAARTDANPDDIINEWTWARRVRTRR